MKIPVSTYWLQLNATFTFNNLENILSWLHELGISTIHVSSIFTAPPGSPRGCGITDSNTLHAETGTLEQLQQTRQQMQQYNITWLQDFTPGHMAFDMHNQRLADVLERGPFSYYHNWFDFNRQHTDPSIQDRLMVPVLHKPLQECIENGDIALDVNNEGFVFTYSGKSFPISVSAYNSILAALPNERGTKAVSTLLKLLYDQATTANPLLKWKQFKHPLVNIFLSNDASVSFLKKFFKTINTNPQLLQEILQQQYYTFYHRTSAVNELIGVNINEEAVFAEYHKLLYNLYEQKIIHGLCINYIDGLRDPAGYISRLRKLFGEDCYMIAEKILAQHEQIPAHWQLQGTTGIDFCTQVSWLLTNKEGARKLVAFYKELFPDVPAYKETAFEKDPASYVYNALLGHNEEGDSPNIPEFSLNKFHESLEQRQQQSPYTLNATSTHNTKLGEDGRIRLHTLSWFTNDWKHHVYHWRQMNELYKSKVNNQLAPTLQDEYHIYQSILAGFPPEALVSEEYINQLKTWFITSVRRANIHSNQQTPDTAYEEAGCRFIENVLSLQHGFLKNFRPFFDAIQQYATVFSLTQALVKIAAPGIPHIYQGSELWNISYAYADNRHPVDYEKRKKYLQQLIALEKKGATELLAWISGNRQGGLEKLFVTWKALQCRQKFPDLFLQGTYQPLYASQETGIVAFARIWQTQWAIVIAPVSDVSLIPKEKGLLSGINLLLPPEVPVTWTNEFTGETISTQAGLPLEAVLNAFPVALLTGEIT